jgi:ribonuclease P protein component
LKDFEKVKITKRAEYVQKFANAKKFISRYFVILYKNKQDLDNLRFGITVSRKVGGAVIRNKYKRIIRVLVKQCSFDGLDGELSINIIAKKSIVQKKFIDIQNDFATCIGGILKYEK